MTSGKSLRTVSVDKCPVCGSSATEVMLRNHDRLHRVPGEFALVRCGSCGLVRLSPRPDEASLAAYYPEDAYYSLQPLKVDEPRGRVAAGLRDGLRHLILPLVVGRFDERQSSRRITSRLVPGFLRRRALYGQDDFPPMASPGAALDIGCGNGAFLHLLQRHGWVVKGVDTSPAAARAAEAVGVSVHVGDVQSLGADENSYDFVHMRHVIEHVDDPVATLSCINQLIKPDGLLYVETPNIGAWSFRRAQEYWFPLDTPRHLWLFSPATLRRAMASAGFEIAKQWTRPFSTYAWELTYREEERQGRVLPARPLTLSATQHPRISMLRLMNAAVRLGSRESGETLCCWARPVENP